MLRTELIFLFTRDLEKLKEEIELYPSENALWQELPGIPNPGGNLAMHVVGNLNHFIGAMLGGTGFIRQREQEFTDMFVPRSEIVASIEDTIIMIRETINNLNGEKLEKAFPLRVMDRHWNTREFLLHLVTHLSYHLGQINYHRRMLSK